MTEARYCIRSDYQSNALLTHERDSPGLYWTDSRIRASLVYQFPVYMLARKLILEHRIDSVIDVGCGVATKLELLHRSLPHVRYAGIDQDHAIQICRQRHDFGHWYVDDFDSPSNELQGLKAGLVICSDVIEHVEDPDKLLDYLKQRAEKEGLILLSTPDRDGLRGKDCTSCPNKYHVREWNRPELKAYLESRGFRIVEQLRQLGVKIAANRIFLQEVVIRALTGKAIRWNQVCVLTNDGEKPFNGHA